MDVHLGRDGTSETRYEGALRRGIDGRKMQNVSVD